MNATIKGNCLRISLSESEDNIVFTMPDGYSYETLLLTGYSNLTYFNPECQVTQGGIYNFPPIRSKSPATITLVKHDPSAVASVLITITKFGQLPDLHYFDAAFEPILVTGDDGNEYNVIPSDQFK